MSPKSQQYTNSHHWAFSSAQERGAAAGTPPQGGRGPGSTPLGLTDGSTPGTPVSIQGNHGTPEMD